MKNRIYNAFVEAGLKAEVDKLSETIIHPNGLRKISPALGHYVALLDSQEYDQEELSTINAHYKTQSRRNALNEISLYLKNFPEGDTKEKLKRNLPDRLK